MRGLLGSLVFLLACGASPTRPDAEGAGRGSSSARAPWAGATLLDEPMGVIARGMREAGLTEGPLWGHGFLTHREARSRPIRIGAGTCLTVVAITTRGIRDLDATLHTPAGEVLAEDAEPDPHPTVQVCGGNRGRRLYYTLQAYDGVGQYLYVSFAGPRDSFARAATVVGGRPGVAADEGADVADDLRLRELSAGVARRGFEPHGTPVPVALAEDQRVRLPLEVEHDHCYTVAAFPSDAIQDLDLRILDEVANEIARDASPVTEPAVQICADSDAQLAVEIHAVRGRGVARVAFFAAATASVGGPNGLWLGERASNRASEEPLDVLEGAELAVHRAAGWTSPRRVARGILVAGEAVEHGARLGGGRCWLVAALGGRGVGRLALRLVDAEGHVMTERSEEGPATAARLCLDGAVAPRIQVTMRRGSGDYAVHVLSRSLPTDLPSEIRRADMGAVLDALESAARGGFRARAEPIAVRSAGAEGTFRMPLVFASGCLRVHVVASGADGRLRAQVERAGRVESRAAGRTAELTTCRRAGDAVLEVATRPGSQAYVTLADAEPNPG